MWRFISCKSLIEESLESDSHCSSLLNIKQQRQTMEDDKQLSKKHIPLIIIGGKITSWMPSVISNHPFRANSTIRTTTIHMQLEITYMGGSLSRQQPSSDLFLLLDIIMHEDNIKDNFCHTPTRVPQNHIVSPTP